MKDPKEFGYDPNKVYWDLAANRSITGKRANEKLASATNDIAEAFVLLTIVPKRIKGDK